MKHAVAFSALVAVVGGCGGGASGDAKEDVSSVQAAMGIAPQPMLCLPGALHCYGTQIRECSARGTPGALVYDCANDPNAYAGNPVVCSQNGGYGDSNFLDVASYWPSGSGSGSPPVGCEHELPTCSIALAETDLNASAHGNAQETPNCGFTNGTVFSAVLESTPFGAKADNLHLRIQSASAFTVGQVVTFAGPSNFTESYGQINGKICGGSPNQGLWAFNGTVTVESLPPDFSLSVNLTCASDPTITVTGTLSGRGAAL